MSHSWQYSTDPSSWVAIAMASELGVAWAATFCRVCVMGTQHFAKAEDLSRRRVDIFRLLLHASAEFKLLWLQSLSIGLASFGW